MNTAFFLTVASIALFLKALAYGILAAIPAGPVNFDIIHHTSKNEKQKAVEVALGAALADAMIFFILASFMPLLRENMPSVPQRAWFISALLFLAIGMYRLFSYRENATSEGNNRLKGTSLAKGFFYVIINPGAYAFWLLIIYLFHIEGARLEYVMISLGIAAGAMGWFLLFITFIQRLHMLYAKLGKIAHTLVPLLFIGFGLYSLFKFFHTKTF